MDNARLDRSIMLNKVSEIAEELQQRDGLSLIQALSMLLSTSTYKKCTDEELSYYYIPYPVLANMFCEELQLPLLYDEICSP